MLAILAHKRAWQEKRKAQGKPYDRPNIVMGNDVHLVWNKGANYFEIEQRLIPLHPDRFTISAEEVLDRVDENTICAVGVLGTSYTFQYDPIEKINNALVALKHDKGLDIPLHVDGASGVFIAPFLNPKLKWDFRLEQVKTINVSGHKFGLVYPGIGWALWRDAARHSAEPHHGDERPGVCREVVQPQLLTRRRHDSGAILQLHSAWPGRLTRGFRRPCATTLVTLPRGMAALGNFNIINDGTYTPCCCCSLKDESRYNAADLVQTLAQRGWIIPAFSMPPDAQSVNAMRMNVKETFSRDMADILIDDIKKAIAKLEATHRKPYHRVGTHHH